MEYEIIRVETKGQGKNKKVIEGSKCNVLRDTCPRDDLPDLLQKFMFNPKDLVTRDEGSWQAGRTFRYTLYERTPLGGLKHLADTHIGVPKYTSPPGNTAA